MPPMSSAERSEVPQADVDKALLALLLRAFAVAKRSGKPDWHLMYAGVLKNRILLLTGNRFDQAEWGHQSFTSLVEMFPETFRVDREQNPPLIELLNPEQLEALLSSGPSDPESAAAHPTVEPPALDSRGWRIRRDLWDAVLGVRDPDAFIWEDGAVIRVPQDLALEHSGPRLPTLTGSELDALQRQFADEQPSEGRYAGVLASWAEGDTRTADLPRQLQHLWYARLKRAVRTRLENWFGENGIDVPADMIQLPASSHERPPKSTSALRALVLACVQQMTEEELQELRLPPMAILRLRR